MDEVPVRDGHKRNKLEKVINVKIDKLPKLFLEKINFNGECWLWKGAITSRGYGSYKSNRKTVAAHRFLWEILNGVIPKGMCVLHKCDIRHCINPDHLFLGTQKVNIRDMFSKGRENNRSGEHNGYAKLSQIEVEEIRLTYKRGKAGTKSEFSQTSLAKKYGISQKIICGIVNSTRWIGEKI